MAARSWRWLRTRIIALLDLPPSVTSDGQEIQASRLGYALYPPKHPETNPR